MLIKSGLELEISEYSVEHAAEIVDLFYGAVHAIDTTIYTQQQKQAWAPRPPDYAKWRTRLETKLPYLAIVGHHLAGFIELEPDGHIDCCYTHPDFQAQGVARSLFRYVECLAIDRGINRLTVEASIPARAFFQAMGFSVMQQNKITIAGEILINYSMEKNIGATFLA
jgi:putative acetyltransferase